MEGPGHVILPLRLYRKEFSLMEEKQLYAIDRLEQAKRDRKSVV